MKNDCCVFKGADANHTIIPVSVLQSGKGIVMQRMLIAQSDMFLNSVTQVDRKDHFSAIRDNIREHTETKCRPEGIGTAIRSGHNDEP